MAAYLTYVHFLCFFVYASLAVVVVLKDARALLNRLCAGVFACIAVWSLGVTFVHNPNVSRETAFLFESVGSIGWVNFAPVLFWFSAVFAGRRSLIRRSLPFVVVLSAIFLIRQWSGLLVADHVSQPFGWIGRWTPSPWTYAFLAYCLGFAAAGFVLILTHGMRTAVVNERRQAWILVSTGSVLLVLGSVSNVRLRMAGLTRIPPLADVLVLFWALATAYAISRYGFLRITPITASDRILSTMADLLFLTDTGGTIAFVNKSALDLLRYHREDLEGRPLRSLLPDSTEALGGLQKVIAGATERCGIETTLATCDGGWVPVSITFSLIRGVGVVCVARDITLQKEVTESLRKATLELESRIQDRTRELQVANEELLKKIADLRSAGMQLGESEERLKILFEFAPDGYYLNDMMGTFVDGNLTFAAEEWMREVASEILRSQGYEAVAASGGAEAIAYYKENAQRVDLVLLDMIMPGLSGLECLRALKALNPEVRIVVCSGYAVEEEIGSVMRAGARGFLHKPFDARKLASAQESALTSA